MSADQRDRTPVKVESDLDYVQSRSLDVLLLFTTFAIWCWILFVPWTGDGVEVGPAAWCGILVMSVGVVSAWLVHRKAHRSAYLIYTAALYVAIALISVGTGMDIAPYGFALLVFIAGTMLDSLLVAVVSILAPVTMVVLGKTVFALAPLSSQVAGPLLVTVGATVVSWISTLNLRTTLDWTSQSMLQAAQNAEQARCHRADLARALRSLDESAHRIDRLNYQLQTALEAAQQAERLKARFAANVSHELRTPLNLIIGFSTLLFQRPELYGGGLSRRCQHDLGIVYRNALQLQRLVNDVLDLSQIESVGLTMTPKPTAPADLIGEAADTVRSLIEAEGLELHVELDPNLPNVMVDPTRIRQVLLNLLTNAVRFTEEGSIFLQAQRIDDELVIHVRDTGIGISEDEIPHLFKEFHKLEEAPSRHHGGSGLGLAISKAFVELHGGRIWVESKRGEGSTFSFSLPIEGGQSSGALISARPATPPESKRVVIALTQSEKGYRLLRRHLPGMQVMMVRSMAQARRSIHQSRPQWLVIDRTIADALKLEPAALAAELESNDVPLLICDFPQERRPLPLSSVAGYLVKPVGNNELLAAVRQLGSAIESILVIDDDRDFTQLVSRVLELPPRAYRIMKAFSAGEALQLAASHPPDLILLDLALPDMRGDRLLAQMRQHPRLAETPVIVITGELEPPAVSAPGDSASLLIAHQAAPHGEGTIFHWVRDIIQGDRLLEQSMVSAEARSTGPRESPPE